MQTVLPAKLVGITALLAILETVAEPGSVLNSPASDSIYKSAFPDLVEILKSALSVPDHVQLAIQVDSALLKQAFFCVSH